jgi:hypothetical protein
MNKLLMTACAVGLLAASPVAAQQTIGPVAGDNAASNSQSGSTSNAQQSLVNGGSSANNGGVRVGDTTSTSGSQSTSGAVSVSESHGGNATTGPSSATATTGAATATANPNASNAGNAQSITLNSVNPDSIRTVPQVYAPALTTTLTETCMGSTSGGASWLGGGFSLGSTWRDSACVRRLNARELAQTLGDREAARAVMCGDPDVADAYERLGRPCPKSPGYRAEIAAQYMPQIPVPPPPPPPAPPVIVNVPAPAAAAVMMAPVPNPAPAPAPVYRRRHVAPPPICHPSAEACHK